MECKTNKMKRNLCFLNLALIGLFASVIVNSCFHGFQMILEKDIRGQFAECAGESHPIFLIISTSISLAF